MTKRSILFLFFVTVLFCLGLVETVDSDLWWHLKVGESVFTHGIPRVDIFSFTAVGQRFIDQEWLSEVLLYLMNAWAGMPGLMISFAFLSVITFGCVYFTRAGLPLVGIPMTILACYSSKFLWQARPQIFNILMLAALLWLLQGVRDRKRSWRWLYVLPVLSLFWVNMHSGNLMGIVVMALVLACDAFQGGVLHSRAEGILRGVEIKHFAVVFSLSVLASLCNPVGYKIFVFPLQTLSTKEIQSFIMEWQSHDFHNPFAWGFLVMLVAGAMSLMLFPKRLDLATAFLYAGSMAGALMSRRHSPFFSVVATPVMIQMISSGITSARWRAFLSLEFSWNFPRGVRYGVFSLLAGLIFVGSFVWSQHKIAGYHRSISQYFPVKAVELLKGRGYSPKRVLNEYAWGGYLIWNGFPVFIDGRTEVYGAQFFKDYLDTMGSREFSPKVRGQLDRWGIEYCLLNARSPLRNALKMTGEWQEVYQDGLSSIVIRKPLPPGSAVKPEGK